MNDRQLEIWCAFYIKYPSRFNNKIENMSEHMSIVSLNVSL